MFDFEDLKNFIRKMLEEHLDYTSHVDEEGGAVVEINYDGTAESIVDNITNSLDDDITNSLANWKNR